MASGAGATNSATTGARVVPFPFDYTKENLASLSSAFEFITSIPDAVLQEGDEPTHRWIHGLRHSYVPRLLPTSLKERGLVQIAKCAYELVSTGLPAGKLLKLKTLIDAAGGATKVAKALLKAKKVSDAKKAGEALMDIVDLLSGVKGIRKECFGWL